MDFDDIPNFMYPLAGCASRFEGDTDNDGDVDDFDLDNFVEDLLGGGEMAMGGGGDDEITAALAEAGIEVSLTNQVHAAMAAASASVGQAAQVVLDSIASEELPESPDVNGDGVVDQQDFAVLHELLGLTP